MPPLTGRVLCVCRSCFRVPKNGAPAPLPKMPSLLRLPLSPPADQSTRIAPAVTGPTAANATPRIVFGEQVGSHELLKLPESRWAEKRNGINLPIAYRVDQTGIKCFWPRRYCRQRLPSHFAPALRSIKGNSSLARSLRGSRTFFPDISPESSAASPAPLNSAGTSEIGKPSFSADKRVAEPTAAILVRARVRASIPAARHLATKKVTAFALVKMIQSNCIQRSNGPIEIGGVFGFQKAHQRQRIHFGAQFL